MSPLKGCLKSSTSSPDSLPSPHSRLPRNNNSFTVLAANLPYQQVENQVHFPPSPSLAITHVVDSSRFYDRTPIQVDKSCALPRRGCPGRTFSAVDVVGRNVPWVPLPPASRRMPTFFAGDDLVDDVVDETGGYGSDDSDHHAVRFGEDMSSISNVFKASTDTAEAPVPSLILDESGSSSEDSDSTSASDCRRHRADQTARNVLYACEPLLPGIGHATVCRSGASTGISASCTLENEQSKQLSARLPAGNPLPSLSRTNATASFSSAWDCLDGF